MAKNFKTKILNYRVIIEKETYSDGTPVYTAFVPSLGITDYGPSLDELLKSLKDGIKSAVECLAEEGKEIPSDKISETIIINTQILAPKKAVVLSKR
jgi:predicted RNase H-like HicB family nuclease